MQGFRVAERIKDFALVERADTYEPRSFYYGINISRCDEPLDQIDVLLLISGMRKSGFETDLTIFVAGRYSQLNGRPAPELIEAEKRKIRTILAASSALSVPLSILRTDDLWYSEKYWKEVDRLKSEEGIIAFERKGISFRDVLETFEPPLRACIPGELSSYLSAFDAPSIYRLLEVAEAGYFASTGINAKIGPSSEEEYDRFIRPFMEIVQLRQPLDFRSLPKNPKPIVPYIGRCGEERIFFSDSKREVEGKIFRLAQRASRTPLFYDAFMSPFARMTALAVEAASVTDSVPVRIGSSKVFDGNGAIKALQNDAKANFTRFAPVVAECIWAYLVRPVQSLLGGVSI